MSGSIYHSSLIWSLTIHASEKNRNTLLGLGDDIQLTRGIKMDKRWSISNRKQVAKINNSQKWKRHMTILLLKIWGKDF
ncbi:hypothetical protein MRB53_022827 [Persea americana]|uniref:Uncharacterized protein n=1 Tax=Persea americana TaxID=3435 RepID=A0ACC2L8Y1_PERAE|nr:hypothetical protein MRB53_022827 [Persea americana]